MSSNAYTADNLVEDESHQVVSSYFLGPKAENFDWFARSLMEVLEAQRDARLDYYPRDGVSNYFKSNIVNLAQPLSRK